MALTNCPECTKEISDKAVSCPHCGVPLSVPRATPAPPVMKASRVAANGHGVGYWSGRLLGAFLRARRGTKVTILAVLALSIASYQYVQWDHARIEAKARAEREAAVERTKAEELLKAEERRKIAANELEKRRRELLPRKGDALKRADQMLTKDPAATLSMLNEFRVLNDPEIQSYITAAEIRNASQGSAKASPTTNIEVRGKRLRVGDSADEVFESLAAVHVVHHRQETSVRDVRDPHSLQVTKYYIVNGKEFSLTFGREKGVGRYLLLYIN